MQIVVVVIIVKSVLVYSKIDELPFPLPSDISTLVRRYKLTDVHYWEIIREVIMLMTLLCFFFDYKREKNNLHGV